MFTGVPTGVPFLRYVVSNTCRVLTKRSSVRDGDKAIPHCSPPAPGSAPERAILGVLSVAGVAGGSRDGGGPGGAAGDVLRGPAAPPARRLADLPGVGDGG